MGPCELFGRVCECFLSGIHLDYVLLGFLCIGYFCISFFLAVHYNYVSISIYCLFFVYSFTLSTVLCISNIAQGSSN
jgi:hypothetical protein